jgi:hypothetical protein
MNYVALFLFFFSQQTGVPQHSVYVVDKVTAETETKMTPYSGTAETGEHHSAPVVMGQFAKTCPSVHFTQDRAVADLILQTQSGSSVLTDAKGNVLYVSPANTLKNMTKDVCRYISSH